MLQSVLPATKGFTVALVLVVVTVPLVRKLSARLRLFDQPGKLKIHSQPTSRLGGVAIVLALIAGTLSAVPTIGIVLLFLSAALAIVWVTGALDDMRGLSPQTRLLAQTSGGIFLYLAGWRVWPSDSGAVAAAASCIWVVLFVNAFNFLDGADGLAAGTSAVIALAYIIFPGAALDATGNAIAWSLLGTCTGFLFFNFPPAKIFMGDSGSTVLGFSVAFLGLDFAARQGSVRSTMGNNSLLCGALIFPLLIAALPLVDAVTVVLRRLINGQSPFHGDRRHSYDFLLASGCTQKRVAISCYLLTGLLGAVGWLASHAEFRLGATLAFATMAMLVLAATWLGSLPPQESQKRHHRA